MVKLLSCDLVVMDLSYGKSLAMQSKVVYNISNVIHGSFLHWSAPFSTYFCSWQTELTKKLSLGKESAIVEGEWRNFSFMEFFSFSNNLLKVASFWLHI